MEGESDNLQIAAMIASSEESVQQAVLSLQNLTLGESSPTRNNEDIDTTDSSEVQDMMTQQQLDSSTRTDANKRQK